LPSYSNPKNIRRGSGINGLIEDLLAALGEHINHILALFQEKLETSPDFKDLYDWIRSPKFEVNIQHLKFIGVNHNGFFAYSVNILLYDLLR
jgi:hypothetical protein